MLSTGRFVRCKEGFAVSVVVTLLSTKPDLKSYSELYEAAGHACEVINCSAFCFSLLL